MPIDLEEIGGEDLSFDELEVETIEVLSEDENETIDIMEEAIVIAGVRTVNGQTGDVILGAEDVNALPNDTSYGYGLSVDGRSVTLVNQNGDEISTIETQDTTYTAGTGIDITDNVISSTQTSAEWGNIAGNIDDQIDLKNALNGKVDKVQGKGLSTNDFTDYYQQKLESLENYDDTEIRGEISEVQGDVSTIEGKIPAQATSSNQLADKAFVNSSLNSITAFYITKDAQGTQFATKAELDATTTFYSGGEVRVPTRNDYCIVLADETQTDPVTGEKPTTRYIYQNGWEFQYVVNKTTLTAAQLAAVNSGATSALIGQITTNQNNITALDASKQDKLHNFYELDFDGTYGYVYGEELENGTYIALNEGYLMNYLGANYYAYQGDIFTKGDIGIGLISQSGIYWLNFDMPDWSSSFSPTSSEMNEALDAKQDKLVSGTNIKTINGSTILTSGNINVPTLGSIASGDTGYVNGGQVYTAIGNIESLMANLYNGGGAQ